MRTLALLLGALIPLGSPCRAEAPSPAVHSRPNPLLIAVDDRKPLLEVSAGTRREGR